MGMAMAASPESAAAGPESAGHRARAQILEAAARRYARFGPRKTTMAEVAGEAGCSRATLYVHFPSKEALYAGLLARETGAFLEELERAMARERGALARLRAVFEATRRSYADNPVLRGALTGDAEMSIEAVAGPATRDYEARVTALLRGLLDEGVEEGALRAVDTEAAAYLMFQLGRLLVTREITGRGDHSFERVLGAMSDLLARGLARARTGGR